MVEGQRERLRREGKSGTQDTDRMQFKEEARLDGSLSRLNLQAPGISLCFHPGGNYSFKTTYHCYGSVSLFLYGWSCSIATGTARSDNIKILRLGFSFRFAG